MPKFFYDSDADLSAIRNKKIAFVGYGNQGMWWMRAIFSKRVMQDTNPTGL